MLASLEYHDNRSAKNVTDDSFCVNGQELVKTNKGYTTKISDNVFYKKIGLNKNSATPESWKANANGIEYTYKKLISPLYSDNSARWVLGQAKRIDVDDPSKHIATYGYRVDSHEVQIDEVVTSEFTLDFEYENSPFSYIEKTRYKEKRPQRLKAISFNYNENYTAKIKEYNFNYETIVNGMGYRISSVEECFYKNGKDCYSPINIIYNEDETADDTIYNEEVIYSKANTSKAGIPLLTSYVSGDIDNDGTTEFCTYSFEYQNIVCGALNENFKARGDAVSVTKLDVNFINESWRAEVPVGGNANEHSKAGEKLRLYRERIYKANSLKLVDVNNDGYLDYCFGISSCAMNNGSGYFLEQHDIEVEGKRFDLNSSIIGNASFVDLNNDGQVDFCKRIQSVALFCSINQTNKEDQKVVLSGQFKVLDLETLVTYKNGEVLKYHDQFPIKIAYLNDDAYLDICYHKNGSFKCALGDKSSNYIDEDKQISVIELPSNYEGNNKFTEMMRSVRAVDMNRDGYSDICYMLDGNLHCKSIEGNSKAVGFEVNDYNNLIDQVISSSSESAVIDLLKTSLSLVDANDDSFVDICYFDGGYMNCAFGYLGGINAPIRLNSMKVSEDIDRKVVTKKTGTKWDYLWGNHKKIASLHDSSKLAYGPITYQKNIFENGRSSICYRGREGLTCFDVPKNNTNMVKKVTSSLGIEHEFFYESSLNEDVFLKDASDVGNSLSINPNIDLVSEYKSRLLGGSDAISNKYNYKNYFVTKNKSSIGFGEIETVDTLSGNKSKSVYSRHFYLRSFITKVEKTAFYNGVDKLVFKEDRVPVVINSSGNIVNDIENGYFYLRQRSSSKFYSDSVVYRTVAAKRLSDLRSATLNNKVSELKGLLDKASAAKTNALAAYNSWKTHSLTMQAKSDILESVMAARNRIGNIKTELSSEDGKFSMLWAAAKYSPLGDIQSEVFANGYTTIRTYYPQSQRLHRVTTAFGSSEAIRDLAYTYNLDGNVTLKKGGHLGY
jgi:hypothetical protein